MRILEYAGLDTSRVVRGYQKVIEALAAGNFRAAQVKKLSNLVHGKFYRARLDDTHRLLFTLVRRGDEVCVLVLETILNHDYDKSRFLRGAAIDESRIPDADWAEALADAQPMRYLHPERSTVHLLDKPLSFDDAQHAIFQEAAPLIVVGSAGSGKTALTLEKLKCVDGEVLYVTHSSYLAQSARDLYFAGGFEGSFQDAAFLSYRDFVESIEVPAGREATWRDFAAWFARMRQSFRNLDPHQAFEEIRGVLAADAAGVLTRTAYRELGVRQSIYPAQARDEVYDLFERYCTWLADAGLYDLNLIAHAWLTRAAPRYDFVVIDEVQDMTPIQLSLVLRTLKHPGQFLLCGDSNQIVHPNFFSWSKVKSLFWNTPELAERQQLRVLRANFRNGEQVTRLANQLLRIKQSRFGSIDRESNFLVASVGGASGAIHLLQDKESTRKELDTRIRRSTAFAVLVMRDEDKAEARKAFSTPLLFSIHEAKGLEYPNIILYRIVSAHRDKFLEITHEVLPEDLVGDTLDYRRARDKTDKSLEIYKFFVNALYVGFTRAIDNLYLLESDPQHPLFALLGVHPVGEVKVDARQSSLEDWNREARKLELQGKAEQAAAIRSAILRQSPVPWPVLDQKQVEERLHKVFREGLPGGKLRQQLLDFATCFDLPLLAEKLAGDAPGRAPRPTVQQHHVLGRKSYLGYFAHNFKDILRQCEQHGLEHRLPMYLTPLMAAAAAGNVALVEALLERGADPEASDAFGWNPLHWAMREAFRDAKFARGPFAALYERLAPPVVDMKSGKRMVRIARHHAEYFLVQTLWVLFRSRFTHTQRRLDPAFDTAGILAVWKDLPANAVLPERNKRAHLSGILSRNEVDSNYPYNRALFRRLTQGWYQFNPELMVRRSQAAAAQIDAPPGALSDSKAQASALPSTGDPASPGATHSAWMSLFQLLNLPFIHTFALLESRHRSRELLQKAGLVLPDASLVFDRSKVANPPAQPAQYIARDRSTPAGTPFAARPQPPPARKGGLAGKPGSAEPAEPAEPAQASLWQDDDLLMPSKGATAGG